METYSHSRLSTFEQCPQKFKFGYIDKVETDVVNTVEAFMGDMVHRTLEKLYKDLKFQKINELNELLDFYNETWEKNWEEGILIVKEAYGPENYKKMGQKMISDYYNRYKPFDQGKTIGLETQNFFELNEEYKIHVRIDRLTMFEDGIYEIHDYKTNSNLRTQDDLDSDRQLAVYAMGVKKMYPDAKKVNLVWHFLAFDKEMRSSRTTEQFETLKKEILELIEKIHDEKEYKPTQSPLCDYCAFKSLCPLWKHLYKVEKLSPKEFKADEGVKLIDKYAELKREEKQLQEKISELSEQINAFGDFMGVRKVFGSDKAVTIWSKEAVKFPGKNDEEREKFVQALKALNLYDKYVSVDNWALEKDYDSFNQIEKKVLDHFGKKQKISRLYLNERRD